MDYKVCIKCEEKKLITEFHKHSNGLYGRRGDCKKCVASYSEKYRKLNKEIIKQKKREYQKNKPEIKRSSHLKKTFGISLDQYDKMLNEQNESCKICNSKSVGNSQHKHLHIDHCHETGKIRGLLCSHCNSLIGFAKNNIEILSKAIEYLKESLT